MQSSNQKFSGGSINTLWGIHCLALVVLLGVIYVIFHQQLFALVEWWRSSSKFGHIIVVLPVFIYQIIKQRKALIRLNPRANLLAVPIFAMVLIGLIAAIVASVDVISQTALLALLPIAVWMVLGRNIAYFMLFPFVLLITTAPLWELITPLLTELTTMVSNSLLSQFGVPVYRTGAYLTIPEGTFEIAHGCGGYRYFIVGVTFGLLVAMYNFNDARTRFLVIAIAIALAIAGNWIRVIAVIWAGHVTEMQHPWVEEHVNLGWWIFLGIFMPYFIVTGRYAASSSINAAVSHDESAIKPASHYLLPAVLLSSLLLVGLSQHLVSRLNGQHPFTLPMSGLNQIQVQGWQGPFNYNGQWEPHFSGAQYERLYSYTTDDMIAHVYIVGYRTQSPGKELVNIFSSFINEDWKSQGSRSQSITLTDHSKVKLNRQRYSGREGSGSVWYWYDVGGVRTANETHAKILEAAKFISGNYYSIGIGIQLQDAVGRNENVASAINQFVAEYYSLVSGVIDDSYQQLKQ